MNQNERAKILLQISDLIGDIISNEKACLITNQLKKYTDDEFKICCEYILTKCRRFPAFAELISPLKIDDRIEAEEISNRVIESLGKYGYTNAEEANTYIGDIGWQAVDSMGGWQNLCLSINIENTTFYKHQIKEAARVKILRARAGIAHLSPQLSYGKENNSNIINMLDKITKPLIS